MTEDEEGFLFPKADQGRCTGCEACERACPLIKRKQAESAEGKESSQKGGSGVFHEPKAFGGWIRDEKIREESSSGGAFSLLADYVLENGGIVFGASMSEELKVRHIGIETSGELGKLRTSKYIQSITGDAYKEVRENLEKGSLVSSAKRSGRREIFFLDLRCKPFMKVSRRYMNPVVWFVHKLFVGRS